MIAQPVQRQAPRNGDLMRFGALASRAAAPYGTLDALHAAAECGSHVIQQAGDYWNRPTAAIGAQYAHMLACLGRTLEALALARRVERWVDAWPPAAVDAAICYEMAELYLELGHAGAHRHWCARGIAGAHPSFHHLFQRYYTEVQLGRWELLPTLLLCQAQGEAVVQGASASDVRALAAEWAVVASTDRLPGRLYVSSQHGSPQGPGFGDVLMFAQFLPRIAQRVSRLIVDVPKELLTLFRASFGHIGNLEVIETPKSILPPHDRAVRYVQLVTSEPPDGLPYLRTGATVPSLGPGVHVGICWAATNRPPAVGPVPSYFRQLPLAALAPLLDIPDVVLHSLQVGRAAVELDAYPVIRRHALRDFADTARVAAACDVVVTVDTSVAHLAGGLGVPTLLLLTACSDWRWGVETAESIWYRGLRMLRPSTGDGASVVARALQLIVAGDLPPRHTREAA